MKLKTSRVKSLHIVGLGLAFATLIGPVWAQEHSATQEKGAAPVRYTSLISA